MTTNTTDNEICCAEFDPAPWHEKEITWQDKLFVKDSMRLFLHMPLFGVFGKAVERLIPKIEAASANPPLEDFIMLARDPSAWKGEVYMNVTKEVPGVENVRLSGTYLTRVFDGPYSAVPKWIKEMEYYVTGQGKTVKDYYFYYTTCPKCAVKYGHNYVVVFAEV